MVSHHQVVLNNERFIDELLEEVQGFDPHDLPPTVLIQHDGARCRVVVPDGWTQEELEDLLFDCLRSVLKNVRLEEE